jgi:hypothetical protein
VDGVRLTEREQEFLAPVAIPGNSDSEQIVVGEQVEELLNHPGFQALVHALHIHAESQLHSRILRKADTEAAPYADAMGHVRGLQEVVPIGKEVGQRVREEREDS